MLLVLLEVVRFVVHVLQETRYDVSDDHEALVETTLESPQLQQSPVY